MNLKNKDITEGMRVVNGKQVWRVVYWNDKYTDALLQSIDRNENRTNNYVIAEFYELYGNEKEPQITWMNGNYFNARNEDEAFDFFMNWLVGDEKKSLKEKVDSRYKYAFSHTKDEYEIVQFDDYNFEILAIPKGKSIFSDDLPKFKIEKTYIYDTCVNNKDITLFVGIVEELGWCFIAFDKLANNNNIFAYIISGKDKHDSYMAFHEYKSEFGLINESKKLKKSLKESVDYEVFAVFPTKNGFIVNTDIKGYQYIQIVNDKITKHSDWREEWFANAKKRAGFKDFDEDDMEERLLARYEKTVRKIIDALGIDKLNESLIESAKPIDEKNVSKFVDELNEWCDDNIHYKDEESAHFTKEYGKLYNFKYDWDYSFGDKGDLLVWDDEGTLNWFEETKVKKFIVKLAQKYGWYCEPCHSNSDFMIGEL